MQLLVTRSYGTTCFKKGKRWSGNVDPVENAKGMIARINQSHIPSESFLISTQVELLISKKLGMKIDNYVDVGSFTNAESKKKRMIKRIA